MTRAEILDAAKQIVTSDRDGRYGEPEDNFEAIAQLWNAYLISSRRTDPYLSAKDVAILMVLFKVGRIATARDLFVDSYIDVAGYIACAEECAAKEEERLAKEEEAMRHICRKCGVDYDTL